MLRVYLDQNHWVSLAKARVGHKTDERFADVVLLLREAVDRGWVSLRRRL
jgi:predicted alpha-1,6-mannanase (GH76 family)